MSVLPRNVKNAPWLNSESSYGGPVVSPVLTSITRLIMATARARAIADHTLAILMRRVYDDGSPEHSADMARGALKSVLRSLHRDCRRAERGVFHICRGRCCCAQRSARVV